VIGFVFRRFLQAIIVVIGVMLIVFILIHLIPGGANGIARAYLGNRATRAQIRQFIHQNHYDESIVVQLTHYLQNLVWHHDLGYSYKLNQGVTTVITERLPKTLILVGIGTVVALIVAVPLGIFQVVRRNKPSDYILTGLSFVFYAMPVFLLGALLILYFSFDLHWFPAEAPQGDTVGSILAQPRGLVLPVVTIAAPVFDHRHQVALMVAVHPLCPLSSRRIRVIGKRLTDETAAISNAQQQAVGRAV